MSSPEPYPGEKLPHQYSFGDFTLDVKTRVLRRRGDEITLRPKSFEVLACLVDHHGKLVTKAELLESVWSNVAVTENSMAQCIAEIRRALDDQSQQLIRTVARRGYMFAGPVAVPIAEMRSPHHDTPGVAVPWPEAPATGTRSRQRWGLAALIPLLLAGGFFAWRARRAGPSETETLRAVPLTTLRGATRYPSFSPDGNQVAFTWVGPNGDNPDIYIQQIGSGPPFRLTTDPRNEYNPVWSPDGRWIAFLRRQWEMETSELRLIPPLGGPERKLRDIHVRDATPPYLAWCPDSNCLLVTDSPGEGMAAALFVVWPDTGEKRQLTYPPPETRGDTNPAISPDGRWLVFRRQINLQNGELYRLPLRALTAAGEPQRLTQATLNADFPTWMPSGKEILFSTNGSNLKGGLWKLTVADQVFRENRPARLPFVGEDGLMPVVSRPQPQRSARLVYVRSFQDSNICRIELSGPGIAASTTPALSISSTRQDSTPQFSPDGRRVAFASDRSGEWEIWLADPDNSNTVQLTRMRANSGAPCWSPDGKQIVFQSNLEGQYEVYTIPVAGGKPRNLTSHAANDARPSFSHDGQWVYFSSNRTGKQQIWKIPESGGAAVQLTNNGAFAAFESPDGAYLYYNQRMDRPSALWRAPTRGGDAARVLDGVVLAAFAVVDGGIYYIDRPLHAGSVLYIDRPSGEARLRYFDLATRKSTTVVHNLGNVFLGLTASPDGRTILYSRIDSSVDDLMLVEDFR